MATAPQPRYARAGDTHLAYQTFGEGVVDLVLLPDGLMTIEGDQSKVMYLPQIFGE